MRAEPTPPPQGQPNGDGPRARRRLPGESQRVEAGISRRHRLACADGGGRPRSRHKMAASEPAVGTAARAKLPVPSPPPDPTAPGHRTRPGTAPTTPRAKVSAHYSPGSESEVRRQGGAHNPSVKTTVTRTAPPPSGPLKQYPKGDVPQRPPRINCAHWTPSSAQRAALTTRDLSGHEEASIREAFPSK